MEKALVILEKHVQWIAIGIGALFLVLMVYSYALQDPVTVPVPGASKPMTPAELDKTIYESTELASLREGMRSGKAVNVTLDPIQGSTFGPILVKPEIIAPPGVADIPGTRPVIPQPPGPEQFATLILSKADYVASMFGRAQVTWAKPQPAPPVNPAAPAPAPAVAAAPLAPQIEVRDVDYISCLFKVKLADLEQGMRKAGIDPIKFPDLANGFQFLGVEVERLEQMPDGKWSKPTIIGPLPPNQEGWKDLPANTVPDKAKKFAYGVWAAQNVRTILQPQFPQVTYGQPWVEPGQPLPAKIEAPQDFQGQQPGAVPGGLPQPGVVPPRGRAPQEFGEGAAPPPVAPRIPPPAPVVPEAGTKEESRVPSGSNRATEARAVPLNVPKVPPRTIFPSGSTTMSRTGPPPVFCPALIANAVSVDPLGLDRST